MSHFKSHLEQMLEDLIQEAEKWDWHQSRQFGGETSIFDSEEKNNLSIRTKTGCQRFLFEEKFRIFGCAKTLECLEERIQSAM